MPVLETLVAVMEISLAAQEVDVTNFRVCNTHISFLMDSMHKVNVYLSPVYKDRTQLWGVVSETAPVDRCDKKSFFIFHQIV